MDSLGRQSHAGPYGKIKMPYFDAKGEGNAVFTKRGIPRAFLLASFYRENRIPFGTEPKKSQDGEWVIGFPMGDKKRPGITSEDIGKCADGIFNKEACSS